MFTIYDPPKDFEELNERCRELVEELWLGVSDRSETFKLRASTSLYEADSNKEFVYRVKEGNLAYIYRDRTLFYFQEGDLIGFERELDLFKPTVTSDFATVLERCKYADFLGTIHSSPANISKWQEFLGRYIAAIYSVARAMFKDAEPVLPEVRCFPEGSEIFSDGDPSKEIYTLADGRAKIWKDGEVCGVIDADQVFGLSGAFSGTPRNASVVADCDCLILALPRDGFLELLMTRPDTVRKLLSELALLINAPSAKTPQKVHPLSL